MSVKIRVKLNIPEWLRHTIVLGAIAAAAAGVFLAFPSP
jgi:hypothetical protein